MALDPAPTRGGSWSTAWIDWFNQLYVTVAAALSDIAGLKSSRTTDEANISSLQSSRTTDEANISSLLSSRTTDEANIVTLQTKAAGIPIASNALTGTLALASQTLTGNATFSGNLTLNGAGLSFGSWQTWTPTLTLTNGATGTPSAQSGQWLQIGPLVYFQLTFSITFATAVQAFFFASLPFTGTGLSFIPASGWCQPNIEQISAAVQGAALVLSPLSGTFPTGTAYQFFAAGVVRVL